MGSGLIYAVIVAAWAVILVPRWLARHDEGIPLIIEGRPEEMTQAVEDRAASTGRLLERRARSQPANQRPVRRRPTRRHRQHTAGTRPPHAAGVRPPHAARRDPAERARSGRPSASPAGARSSVQVRRRWMLVLLAVTSVALGVAGVLARVPLWAAGVALAALIGYAGWLRGEVKRARRRDRRRQLLARQAAARRHAVRAARRRFPARPRASAPSRPVLVNPDGTWNPLPLPLPTYITAPIVDRPPTRLIDVSATGLAWTSGGLQPQPVGIESAVAKTALPETALTELVESGADGQDIPLDEREAVNG